MSNILNVLIVEDELVIAEMLKTMLEELNCKVVGMAKNYEQAKNQIELHKNIDLVFLDINLTATKTGIDVAKLIKEAYQIPFIYLTSYSDTSTIVNASKTLPEAYINKPFNKTLLLTTLEVFRQKNQSNQFYIKDGIDQVKINANEVLFIKKDGNYLEIFTEQKRYTTRDTVDNFIQSTNSPNFIRVHRSYAVNLGKVKGINGKHLNISGKEIPYSRIHKDKILALINI